MSGPDIEATFGGVTLDGIYFNGTYFTEAYHDDGTIRYWDAVAADSGEWSVQDGQFCTFYEGQEGACFTVERDGDQLLHLLREGPGHRRDRPEEMDLARLDPRPRQHLPRDPRGRL